MTGNGVIHVNGVNGGIVVYSSNAAAVTVTGSIAGADLVLTGGVRAARDADREPVEPAAADRAGYHSFRRQL